MAVNQRLNHGPVRHQEAGAGTDAPMPDSQRVGLTADRSKVKSSQEQSTDQDPAYHLLTSL